MALTLAVIGGVVVVAMFHFAAAGKPLHHEFADKAAAVDGEMVDVIGNMPLVRAFCGRPPRASPLRRHGRPRADGAAAQPALSRAAAPRACGDHRGAHRRPARLGDPALAARRDLDRRCRARLHARPLGAARDARSCGRAGRRHAASGAAVGSALDPAGAARSARSSRGGAAARLWRERPVRERLVPLSAADERLFDNLSLRIEPGQRVGLVGQSGGGKSTLFALLQRLYDVESGGVLVDGQDITRVTQESLRAAIAVVPQDVSMFHRSVMENIRYGRPDARDAEVSPRRTPRAVSISSRRLPNGMATIVGRSRHETLRRPAPADRDRARVAEGRAAAAARRGDLGARQRVRGSGARGARRG